MSSDNGAEPDFSLAVCAVAMHEMYTSLRDAGFNERQALRIIIASMKSCPCGGMDS